jgi:predicted phosphodiesterase
MNNMRSYTNKEGEVIEVSQEHLDTAVRIKRELQMASPSHRCNWHQHKILMEKEGFYDSEVSENYRLMIKNYQASIGQLDSKEKYADLVATSKLNSIKEAVGELAYKKREVQMESLKLGKLKRDLTLLGVIAEQVREAMLNELNQLIPSFAYQERLPIGKKRMIVMISDWHIGAVIVNVMGNSYNFSIAKKRVAKFVKRIIEIAKAEGINDIDVVCMGDMTEHVHMRKTQSFDAEFPLAVQIVKAYELIRDLLVNLSEHFNVTYRGVSGNHDRMEGNKEDNIDSDSTIFVINYMIKEFVEQAKAPRIQYFEVDNINYSTSFSVNGIKMKFVHGDNERGSNKLASHSDMDNTSYNILAMGHLHHFSVTEVGQNKYEVYVGSLQGVNNYAMKGKFLSNASQGLIIINEYGEIDIKRIDLQDV